MFFKAVLRDSPNQDVMLLHTARNTYIHMKYNLQKEKAAKITVTLWLMFYLLHHHQMLSKQ